MSEATTTQKAESSRDATATAPAEPQIRVAPGPHIHTGGFTTRWMMLDVVLALVPAIIMATVVFGGYALAQIALVVSACMLSEAVLTRMRGKPVRLDDGSALVTGLILALSLPWSAPWYVGVVAGFVAIALGKWVFGGLGYNLFNPAMVGRAFVMISFAGALSAGAYSAGADAALPLALGDPDTLTQATPLAQAKEMATQAGMQPDGLPGLWTLFVGTHNGSLGETSIIALLLGGLYLVLRRTASWEIPAGVILGTALLALVGDLVRGGDMWTVGLHVFSGSMIFGAFFIATDPVSSPLTPRGKFAFGLGVGLLIYVIRTFSGYPEGTMFAILLMNAVVPLINRATIPRPLGGRPQPAPAK